MYGNIYVLILKPIRGPYVSVASDGVQVPCRHPKEEETTVESRPSWQVDACPSWCRGDHGEHDHPDDRVHRSDSVAVPVVGRRTVFEGASIRREVHATEFDVALSRPDGECETWLYVGAGPAMSLDVTAESAERLVRHIVDTLRSR